MSQTSQLCWILKIHYNTLQYVSQYSTGPVEGDIELYFACSTHDKQDMKNWTECGPKIWKINKVSSGESCNESVKASIQIQCVPGHGGADWDPETSTTPWETSRRQFGGRSHRGLWSEMFLCWDLLTIVWVFKNTTTKK